MPVAVAAAVETGVIARPVLRTPIATPANMMVMGPGGYRFGDYWKLGLPVMLWFIAVGLVVIPILWPF